MQVQQVLSNLRQQGRALRGALDEVESAVKLLEGLVPNGAAPAKAKGRKGKAKGTRKPMSAAARKKIGDAARARWALKKAEGGGKK